MKGKKSSKWSYILLISFLVIASIILYNVFNSGVSDSDVSLNYSEQRWIQNNKNEIINIMIPNNVPIFSSEGKGAFFSFLDYFESRTELEFNKTPYVIGETNSSKDNCFRILGSNEKLSNNDLLFYSDNYVVLSKSSQKMISLNELNGTIGILNGDFNAVTTYLDSNNLTFSRLADINVLSSSLDNGSITYAIIPLNLYLDVITQKGYHVVNHLNDLALKYVLTLNNDNANLNNIIKKYYDVFKINSLSTDYYGELLNLYTTIKTIDDKSKTDFKSKRYVYGYVENAPYEVNKDNELGGISNEFINSFTTFSNVEFNFREYASVEELNKALENGKIDIALNYYNLNSANTYKTVDLIDSKYVILSSDRSFVIDTIKSLKGVSIYTLGNTKLSNYIEKNSDFNAKEVNEVSFLKGKDLILLDYNVYEYYKNVYFKNYAIAYQNKATDNYNYLINKDLSNEFFYNILNYYLSTINHDKFKSVGMEKLLSKTINIDLSLLWLYVILIPAVVIIISLVLRKRKKIIKVRNDVKIKYIDPLTSLKNRYYLSNNITKWEDNNIYPQSIVVININNLKDINDAYGYEGGDQLIKTAANILINNQLEKTDIMRTDGNEFVIYMVGYDESAVIAYVRKLYRLLKDLPYEYGASLGYSMIEDDIKTIEDAINEAILDMITNREVRKNNDI
jgi:diguanylate cyclase (GGDEF)-like protein